MWKWPFSSDFQKPKLMITDVHKAQTTNDVSSTQGSLSAKIVSLTVHWHFSSPDPAPLCHTGFEHVISYPCPLVKVSCSGV